MSTISFSQGFCTLSVPSTALQTSAAFVPTQWCGKRRQSSLLAGPPTAVVFPLTWTKSFTKEAFVPWNQCNKHKRGGGGSMTVPYYKISSTYNFDFLTVICLKNTKFVKNKTKNSKETSEHQNYISNSSFLKS